nr:MAG TPA: hypothetical protein [Caudoviricetes sp.]
MSFITNWTIYKFRCLPDLLINQSLFNRKL